MTLSSSVTHVRELKCPHEDSELSAYVTPFDALQFTKCQCQK